MLTTEPEARGFIEGERDVCAARGRVITGCSSEAALSR